MERGMSSELVIGVRHNAISLVSAVTVVIFGAFLERICLGMRPRIGA